MRKHQQGSALLGNLAVISLILGVIGYGMWFANMKDLTRVSGMLPNLYSTYMEQWVNDADAVTFCKSDYADDIKDQSLFVNGATPAYVIQSILICEKFERAITQNKSDVDSYFSSDFYKKYKAGKDLGFSEMSYEREKLIAFKERMFSSTSEYWNAKQKYEAEKVTPKYYAAKIKSGYPSVDPEIKTRFDAADQALVSEKYTRFLEMYKEIETLTASGK